MATFSTKAAGDANADGQTTWNQAGHPGAGDTATVTHALTVGAGETFACLGLTIGTGGSLAPLEPENSTALVDVGAGGIAVTGTGILDGTGRMNVNCAGSLTVAATAALNCYRLTFDATDGTPTIAGAIIDAVTVFDCYGVTYALAGDTTMYPLVTMMNGTLSTGASTLDSATVALNGGALTTGTGAWTSGAVGLHNTAALTIGGPWAHLDLFTMDSGTLAGAPRLTDGDTITGGAVADGTVLTVTGAVSISDQYAALALGTLAIDLYGTLNLTNGGNVSGQSGLTVRNMEYNAAVNRIGDWTGLTITNPGKNSMTGETGVHGILGPSITGATGVHAAG